MEQKLLLEELGVDYMQGFYFSKPVRKDVFTDYVKVVTAMNEQLMQLGCVLQFVRSGRVVVTKSSFERVDEYLEKRGKKYEQRGI